MAGIVLALAFAREDLTNNDRSIKSGTEEVMKKSAVIAALAALGTGWMPLAQAAVIFSENFNDGTVDAAITGSATLAVDTAPSGAQFLGLNDGTNNTDPSNRGLSNNTVTLSLSGLATHSTATLNFSLYVINSMDGSEPFGVSELTAGALLAATCSNVFGVHQCSVTTPTAVTLSPDAVSTLGFSPLNTGVTAPDSIYNFSLTFAHSDSSLTAAFIYSGLQGLADESWGLDNISVEINGTPPTGAPEPGSLALLGCGLAGLWIARRRARRS